MKLEKTETRPSPPLGDLQDGMLAYFNSQAPFADANVEVRLGVLAPPSGDWRVR